MNDKGQIKDIQQNRQTSPSASFDSFVLEKSIFSNVFQKDIKRVYIYKKSERLAKAMHLVTPAFAGTPALHDRANRIAVSLIDAAILPPSASREALSRELLALSSLLAIAKTGGMLSSMNADVIAREAHALLEEVAGYEEPRVSLPEVPTLAELSREAVSRAGVREREEVAEATSSPKERLNPPRPKGQSESVIKDTKPVQGLTSRQEAIIAILSSRGPSFIKDISTVIRDVSEKTIQRELGALVESGKVTRTGERRWTSYALA
ncbi:MAG: hypothetical protein KBC16_03880 [Candidatus Pacebacteria bacterium]|nr:hypothetical protein [Candidatus Paceibacterota bacterium]